MYEVQLTKSAWKTYGRLTPKLKRGVDRCLTYLEVSPTRGPNIKKLRGLQGCYRYQMGGWRVIYEVEEDPRLVTVFDISPRGDAY